MVNKWAKADPRNPMKLPCAHVLIFHNKSPRVLNALQFDWSHHPDKKLNLIAYKGEEICKRFWGIHKNHIIDLEL